MHRDLNNDKWKVILSCLGLDTLDDLYAVRVTSHVQSQLSGRSVLPKSDVYIVKAKLKSDFLTENNFIIDEDMYDEELKNVHIEKIKGSGISCKIRASKSFTYEKLTIDSFSKLFDDAMIGCGMSLFVKNVEELQLNQKILEAWGIKIEEFRKYWATYIEFGEIKNILLNQDICKLIKKKAEELIREKIDTNSYIKGVVFRGDSIFEEPYNAPMIFSHGQLMENVISEYSVTTGSGRHKGTYTIVIKP